eukprot:1530969-Amphidinium_carterae.1
MTAPPTTTQSQILSCRSLRAEVQKVRKALPAYFSELLTTFGQTCPKDTRQGIGVAGMQQVTTTSAERGCCAIAGGLPAPITDTRWER